jgi:hypothetical protein
VTFAGRAPGTFAFLALAVSAAMLPAAAQAAPVARHQLVGASRRDGAGLPVQSAARHRAERGTVTGTVLNSSGKPLADVCVIVQRVGTVSRPAGRAAVTTRDGMFELVGLTPGGYDLSYRSCRTPAGRIEWPSGAALRPAALLVPLTPSRAQVIGGRLVTLGPVRVRSAAKTPALSIMPTRPAIRRLTVRQLRARQGGNPFGAISGTVLGPKGRPVAGLCFEVNFGGGYFGGPIGKNGRYNTGRNVPPGKYTVEFTPSCGFPALPTGNWAPQWYRGAYSQAAATTVVVQAGRTTAGIGGVMRRGGEISGTVTGRSGRAVAKVCVVAVSRTGAFAGQVTTPASGRYRIEALDPGRYQVAFFPNCGESSLYLPQWWPDAASQARSGLIRLGFGQHRDHVDARLAVGGTISGVVRFRSRRGRAIKGICVFVQPAGQPLAPGFGAASGRNGGYAVQGLPAGRYDLSFGTGCNNNGNYLYQNYSRAVRAGLDRVTRHIDAYLQPGAILTGSVTLAADGRRLPGICADVDNGLAFGETTRDGSYFINQIPPGRDNTVEFENCGRTGNYAPQYYQDQANEAAAATINFRGGQVTAGIDAALLPGATVAGMLTTTSGRKLADVCADAIPASEVSAFGSGAAEFGGYFAQSSDGRYAIENLPGGQYEVAFGTCDGPNVADQWFMGQRGVAAADRIDVPAAGIISGINAVLQPAGIITGKVAGAASQPQSFVCLTVTNARTGIAAFEQPFTAEGQSYAVGGLATGSYLVEFAACGGQNLALQWYDRAASPGQARDVRVVAGRVTRSVSANLTVGGVITGRVVSKTSGKPLGAVCVTASGIVEPFTGFGESSRSGRYRLTGLNTGAYRLFFSPCGAANLITQVTGRVHATAGRTVTGIDAAMTAYRGGAISGQIRAGSSRPAPALGVCVEAIPMAGAAAGSFEGFGTAGIGGYYKISDLVPGRYKVFIGEPACESDPGDLVPQWYMARSSEATATPVTVTAGRVSRRIGATLLADGTIAGTVTGPAPDHGGLAGICVRAVPVAAGTVPLLTVSADATGSYLLAGLTPGRYLVQFFADCGTTGYATQWWRNASSAGAATTVVVRADATRSGIDAAMVPRS